MQKVFKYIAKCIGDCKFDIPMKAKFCSFQMQGNFPAFWMEVDEANPTEVRTFRVFGTGHEVTNGYEYRGTAIDGPLVWHLYERVGD